MCGIAGIIYRGGNGAHRLGADMTRMLQSMKHRGPDSTGYALYRRPTSDLVMRIKLADANANGDIEYADRLRRRREEVKSRIRAAGAALHSIEEINDYTIAATLDYDGDLKHLADYVESVPGAEVLSAGSALERAETGYLPAEVDRASRGQTHHSGCLRSPKERKGMYGSGSDGAGGRATGRKSRRPRTGTSSTASRSGEGETVRRKTCRCPGPASVTPFSPRTVTVSPDR